MTLRCVDCGVPIQKKGRGGRTPKYCVECRKKRQEEYKNERSK